MVLCTHEDRPSHFIGVKLLALSLARHCPGVTLKVWCSSASPRFLEWLDEQHNTIWQDSSALSIRGWNVKPSILLAELKSGSAEAFWMDADIIVARDFRAELRQISANTVIATEEPRWTWDPHGSFPRTIGLGLHPGRQLSTTANSCVVRVSSAHVPLMERWDSILRSRPYRDAQTREFGDRPIQYKGDQDVLTGLLGAAEFSDIDVHLLRRGRMIAQCLAYAGYSASERIRNIPARLPPLIHAQAQKPWSTDAGVMAELSPYSAVAADYRDEIDEAMDWCIPRSLTARLLNRACLGEPNLRGLPFALAWGVRHRVRELMTST